MRGLIPFALAALLACGGCAVRMAATPADETPAGVPRSVPPKPPSQPAAPDRSVGGTGSPGSQAAPAPAAVPVAAASPSTETRQAAESQAPAATASTYVFSPQQAVSASPSALPPAGGAPPEPAKSAPVPEIKASASRETARSLRQDGTPGTRPGELQLLVVASASEIATGGIMTVDVMASSSTAVVDAPFNLIFDPNVVEFVDGVPGDFLTQGGSSIVFLADGRSRPGDVAVAAGRVERGHGANGAGLLCRVRFRGVGVGTTAVLVGQAKAWGTRGEELTVLSGGTSLAVN